jgi:hypothetical protein
MQLLVLGGYVDVHDPENFLTYRTLFMSATDEEMHNAHE